MQLLRHRIAGMHLLLVLALVAPSWAFAMDTPPAPVPVAAAAPPPSAPTADDPTLRLAERVARAVRRGELTRDEADTFQRYVARRMLAGPITAAEIDALFLGELAEPGAHKQAPSPTAAAQPAPQQPAPVDAQPSDAGPPLWALGAGLFGLLGIAGLVGWRVRSTGQDGS